MDGGSPYARMMSLMMGETGSGPAAGESDRAGLNGGPAMMRLGRVVSRAPLKVSVAGVTQPPEALRINERLTKGAKWKTTLKAPVATLDASATPPAAVLDKLSGPLSGPVSCNGEGCDAQLSSVTSGTLSAETAALYQAEVEQLEIDLEAGDQVLLLTEDDQIFFILCKVVDAV